MRTLHLGWFIPSISEAVLVLVVVISCIIGRALLASQSEVRVLTAVYTRRISVQLGVWTTKSGLYYFRQRYLPFVELKHDNLICQIEHISVDTSGTCFIREEVEEQDMATLWSSGE